MVLELRKFDPAAYLDTPESLAAYLEDAMSDTPEEFLEALGVVARAKGMTEVARSANLARPALYRALSSSGRPEFGTVASVLKSLGLVMHVAAASSHGYAPRGTAGKKTGLASGPKKQPAIVNSEKQNKPTARSQKVGSSTAAVDLMKVSAKRPQKSASEERARLRSPRAASRPKIKSIAG